MNKNTINILLLIISISFCYFILEITSAIIISNQEKQMSLVWDENHFPNMKYQVLDNNMMYRILPNSNFTANGKIESINSLGLRNQELKEKEKNEIKILILGDSVTFGTGVNSEETYPQILEELLNNNNPKYKFSVINSGVPGYNTIQESAFFEKYHKIINPNIVILSFVENDFEIGTDSYLNETSEKLMHMRIQGSKKTPMILPLGNQINIFLMKKSKFFVLLNEILAKLIDKEEASIFTQNSIYYKDYEETKSAIQNIKRISLKENYKFFIIIFPSTKYKFSSYPNLGWVQNIKKIANEKEIKIFDLIDYLKEYNVKKIRYDKGAHLNKKGHKIVAEKIYEILRIE